MFYLGFQSVDQLAVLSENGQVEVVMIVGNENLSVVVDSNSDGVVRYSFPSDLPKKLSFVVENLDAVCPVVWDEDLLPVVDDDAIGELQMLWTSELGEDVAHLIEDDHSHHFALYDDDPPLVVYGDSSRML